MIEPTKPRFFRSATNNKISWEYYDLGCFFFTISLGQLEIQINRWRS